MCLPLAAVAVITTVASTALSAYGAYAQGRAQEAQNKYAAGVAANQAELVKRTSEQNISLVQEEGKTETQRFRREVAAVEGRQKAVLASQGVGGGSVTAADIAASTFGTAQLDEMAIRFNTDSKAYALKTGAEYERYDLESKRKGYLLAGKSAAQGGLLSAGATLLGGAAQVGSAYQKYKDAQPKKKEG